MSIRRYSQHAAGRRPLAFSVLLLGVTLAFAAPAGAALGPVNAPQILGVAPVPGPAAAPAKASPTMGILKTSPDVGSAGRTMSIAGAGLPAGKDVQIVWMTATVRWILDARLDSVDYIGRQVDKWGAVIGHATTDSSGSFSYLGRVPRDYGGLHDMFAVVDGVQYAKGGYLLQRRLTISPTRGPIGTLITVHATGLGSPLYDSAGAIYYDNHYTGVFTANTTRGDATFQIRAAGPVGRHQIVSGPAITVDYLNAPQSPQPWQPLFKRTFTVTRDAGAPKARLSWPANVAPTVAPSTTIDQTQLASAGVNVTAKLSATVGTVLSKTSLDATGLTPGAPVAVQWGTVVGNRVNCTGQCWSVATLPLGSATAGADGSLHRTLTIPDNLGGWHVLQLVQNGEIRAQVPYFVTRSLVKVPRQVREGARFTIHLKGLGWTQLDNTAAVTYDNSYVGYGCGFNSNGDVVLNLVASGGPGTHLIDLYPLLYSQNPVYVGAAGVYGMVPFLSYAQDAPGLALGYKLPAIRLAIRVVGSTK